MNMSKKTYILFVVPIVIIFSIVVIIPFFIGLFYSFTNWNGISSEFEFIGLQNFQNIMGDVEFMRALWLTLLYALITVILVNIIGLGFALLVTSKTKLKLFARGVFFFPNLIGGLILGFTWQFIFSQVFVSIGELISGVGNTNAVFFNWLTEPTSAFFAMCLVSAWSMSGYVMVIYIASLESISNEVIEASKVDGTSIFGTFFKIKLPLIMPGLTISLFVTLSNALKVYDLNLSLTGGGPYQSTEMITMNIYNEAFSYFNLGYAQSKAIVFLVVIFVITAIQLSITRKGEVEN